MAKKWYTILNTVTLAKKFVYEDKFPIQVAMDEVKYQNPQQSMLVASETTDEEYTELVIQAKEEVTAKAKVGPLFSNYMVDNDGNIVLPDGEVLFWLNTEKRKPKEAEKLDPVMVAVVELRGLDRYTIHIANPNRLPIKHVEVNFASHVVHTSVILKSSNWYPTNKCREFLTYDGGCSFDDAWNEDLTVVIQTTNSSDFTAVIKLYT